MKFQNYRFFFFLISFVLTSCIFIVCYFVFKEPNEKNVLTLYGNVDVRLVDVGFRVPGLVKQLYFEEGDFVRKGDLVSVLDQSPYDAELAQSEANLAVIQARLSNAEILYLRRLELVKTGSVSQEDLDNAFTNFSLLKADFDAAMASVAVAKDRLDYTKTYAANDGILLTRIREPGTTVNPADPVCTISITDPVWIRAFVNEPNLGNIAFGMDALVFTDTVGVKSYKGKIGFISPIAEFTPKTVQTTDLRTDLVYRLRIYVDDPDFVLKQGMPVTVKVQLDSLGTR